MFPSKADGPLPRRGRSFDSGKMMYDDKQINNEVSGSDRLISGFIEERRNLSF